MQDCRDSYKSKWLEQQEEYENTTAFIGRRLGHQPTNPYSFMTNCNTGHDHLLQIKRALLAPISPKPIIDNSSMMVADAPPTLVLSVYFMFSRTLQILIIKALVLLHFIYVLMVHRHNRETISMQIKQLDAPLFMQFHNTHIIDVHYFKFNS